MKVMDPSELVKQPQDVTENPFARSAKDDGNRQKTGFSLAAEEVQENGVPKERQSSKNVIMNPKRMNPF